MEKKVKLIFILYIYTNVFYFICSYKMKLCERLRLLIWFTVNYYTNSLGDVLHWWEMLVVQSEILYSSEETENRLFSGQLRQKCNLSKF